MAPGLGKRKRVTREELEQSSRSQSPASAASDSDGAEDLQAIFRRAFEAKFKPLAVEPKKPKLEAQKQPDEEEDSEAESDWSGISDDSTDQIQIVTYTDVHQTPASDDDETSRAAKKAFMTSKPPSSTSTSTNPNSSSKRKPPTATPEATDATNLKHDLALQKLLRESHLLSASSSGTSTPTSLAATGVARHKSTDLHLQALGAKTSVFTQKKMPMAQRQHEAAKARGIEEKRRARAKEAGIVLEVEKRVGKSEREKKRERGVGGPSIGRFRGGTLTLSKGDVRSITGGGKRKGKGRGGGKKGW
ncbi:hypothetical protein IQ07DRAFT_566014 [Pyrenochaeta sp. DS3sAY3a]|nr:hypothetical protein IQ07DRAFT_566014 [Pyrenochaeta sp. DS3sAY3a]